MMVSVEPLREALKDKEDDELRNIAREVGYFAKSGKNAQGHSYNFANAQRIKREVGLELPSTGIPKRKIHHEKALAIARAAGIDPVEVGL
jgi:hypothetical protein